VCKYEETKLKKIPNGMVFLVRKKSKNEYSPKMGFIEREMRTPMSGKSCMGVLQGVLNAKFLPLRAADEKPNYMAPPRCSSLRQKKRLRFRLEPGTSYFARFYADHLAMFSYNKMDKVNY
jgi:hypothetical protein